MTDDTLSGPVTRREFKDALGELEHKIDELFKAKQVSWPLIVAIGGLALTVLGFGISNWARMIAVEGQSASSAASVGEFRERIRGLESNLRAIQIENETQNKWLASEARLEKQHMDQLLAMRLPGWPQRTYFGLDGIGEAETPNGKR